MTPDSQCHMGGYMILTSIDLIFVELCIIIKPLQLTCPNGKIKLINFFVESQYECDDLIKKYLNI